MESKVYICKQNFVDESECVNKLFDKSDLEELTSDVLVFTAKSKYKENDDVLCQFPSKKRQLKFPFSDMELEVCINDQKMYLN